MSKYIIPANQAKKYKDKFEIAKLKSSKKLIYILDKFVNQYDELKDSLSNISPRKITE